MSKWISVEERLPEPRQHVLFYSPGEFWRPVIVAGFYSSVRKHVPSFTDNVEGYTFYHPSVTHWMPLVSPPK